MNEEKMRDVEDLSGLEFVTSSFSNGAGGMCVDVAKRDDGFRVVRHSQRPDGANLLFTPDEWAAFKLGMQADEF